MSEELDQRRLAESNQQIVELLRDEIAKRGPITFARFMDFAIYHRQHGYYASQAVRVGTEGDFLTAPETDPIFGWTLARQLVECWERLDRPEDLTILEAGAGRGTLARDILEGLQTLAPDCFAATSYCLADVNPTRLTEAQRLLVEAGFGEHLVENRRKPLTGVVLANELLDSFPFHRLIVEQGELREIYTGWRDGWFVDELGPLSDERLAEPVEGVTLQEGQRLEVSPAAWRWAETLGERIERGYAILIDYGYPAAELYSPDRAEGMLRTYHEHLASNDPYRYVGQQDITRHVDFSAVARGAAEGGLAELGLVSQAAFVAGLGIEELLMRVQREAGDSDMYRYVNARQTVMHLLDPRSLGRFRVLMLGKDAPAEPQLRGLSFDFPGFPV